MNITPDTNIRLLKCPLQLDNKNQITFSNATSQYNYFSSLSYLDVDASYYQRKDRSIYYPDIFDNLVEYNYCMYQNNNYSNKWYYAFITDMEYISDHCTRIEIETDVFQTWQHELNYKQSFVVREHTNNDTIGANLIPENLNVGEMIQEGESKITTIDDFLYVGVLSDWKPTTGGIGTGDQYDGITIYNNSVFGHQLYLFKLYKKASGNTDPDVDDLRKYILITNSDGHIADIKDMFIIPSGVINNNYRSKISVDRTIIGDVHVTFDYWTISENFATNTITFNTPKVTSFTGVTIRNNKCYTYPYNYLLVTNNNGNHNIYKYEDFSNTTYATFDVELAIAIGCSGRCVPTNYKGSAKNDDEALPLGKYPTCNWSADSYTNWLTQQAVNIPTKIVSSAVSAGTNIVAGNPVGAAINTAKDIAGLIGSFYAANLSPNIEGGGNTGDALTSAKRNNFIFKNMRPKNDYIKEIDDYFTMFGYQTNKLKVPNITGRSNWNYVETNNINILADIPERDLETIKNMFNNGITLWHTTSHFLDYSQTNSIVS